MKWMSNYIILLQYYIAMQHKNNTKYDNIDCTCMSTNTGMSMLQASTYMLKCAASVQQYIGFSLINIATV